MTRFERPAAAPKVLQNGGAEVTALEYRIQADPQRGGTLLPRVRLSEGLGGW